MKWGQCYLLVTGVATLTLSLILTSGVPGVDAKIECHYCGIRQLCSLPYEENKAEWINCPVSCMKFDGFASDGKRIIHRGCGDIDTNICNKTTEWFGAKGRTCLCNADRCNSSTSYNSNKLFTALSILVAVSVLAKF